MMRVVHAITMAFYGLCVACALAVLAGGAAGAGIIVAHVLIFGLPR